jgi:hypothetical protein
MKGKDMTDIYDQELKLRDKTFKFRKWKVKDKKKYLENIQSTPMSREALVYDCMEDKKIALDEEEIKYVLIQIREASIKDPIEYTFTCENCNGQYDYSAKLSEIITLDGSNVGEIVSGSTSFEMGHVQNRDFYQGLVLSALHEEDKELIDFMLHIKSFNGNDGFTFDMLNDFVSNMDVKEFEVAFDKWQKMKLTTNNVSSVICPHCNHEEWYQFDALPGFFPASWRIA